MIISKGLFRAGMRHNIVEMNTRKLKKAKAILEDLFVTAYNVWSKD